MGWYLARDSEARAVRGWRDRRGVEKQKRERCWGAGSSRVKLKILECFF